MFADVINISTMNIIIDRKYCKKDYSIGNLYIDGNWICNILEDPDRGLYDWMPKSEISAKKIYGRTAIPKGRYKVIISYSPKFANRSWAKKYNGRIPELLNVKGYEGIRIHPGNTAADTLGCLLPGLNTSKGKVTKSTECFDRLMDYIIPALVTNEEVWIEIR